MANKKSRCKSNIWTIIEAIVIILLFIAFGVGYYFFMGYLDMSAYEQSKYMQACFVGGDLPFVPGALYLEWIFDYMLRGLFLLIGNHVVAAFWLQFAIIVIAIFVLYRGMRKITHPAIAVIITALAIGISLFSFIRIPLNSGRIIFLIFAICFYFISLLVHKHKIKISEREKADLDINITESPVNEENNVKEEKPAIKFLDNPLPGPKKHVSKTLDFDLKDEDLADGSMEYDIEVSEDDDFDL